VRTALVTGGPAAWRDLQGDILWSDADFLVVRLETRDDAGSSFYDVRMPRAFCLEIEEEEPSA